MIHSLFSEDGSLEGLASLIDEAGRTGCDRGLVVLGGIGNEFDRPAATAYFRARTQPLAGGLFPAIVFDRRVHPTGWVVYGFERAPRLTVIEQVSDLDRNPIDCDGEAADLDETCMVLVDGHANRLSTFLNAVFADEAGSTRYIGGGAGSLESNQHPCIISNRGLLRDAAVIVRTGVRAGVGVSHGWHAASTTMRATATAGNTLCQIDFKPAFEVYRDLVESFHGHSVDPDNMLASASMYPIGIRRLGGSVIVRDPIAVTAAGEIVCVGEFDKDCFVHLLTSNHAALLRSAEEANRQADEDLAGHAGQKVIFDCVSRYLLLKEDFVEEIRLLSDGDVVTSGALSLGEVASDGRGFLEFCNKTTAVALFSGA